MTTPDTPNSEGADASAPSGATAPAAGHGRAGRNVQAAAGVGIGLGALILLSLYTWRPAFLALMIAAMCIAVIELGQAFAVRGVRLAVVPLLVGTTGTILATYARGFEGLAVGFALTCIASVLWRMREGPNDYVRDATASWFSAAYVPFLAGFAVVLFRYPDGPDYVVLLVALAVLNDVGGYAFGVAIGKHPMAPTISPKKSWEGFIGSVVFSIVGGALMVSLLVGGDDSWLVLSLKGAVLGVFTAFAATLGDLAESLVKRDLGVKDMGDLLPGHGGIMDRLDSILFVAPTVYLGMRALDLLPFSLLH